MELIEYKDWIKKPKKQREILGFYREPPEFCMFKCGEWEKYKKYLKHQYPIQYFVREVFWFNLTILFKRTKDKLRYLFCLMFRRAHVLKLDGLSPISNDCDSLLEKSIEKVIIKFMEEERIDIVDWDSDEGHSNAMKTFKEAYNYFKYKKPEIQKEIDGLMKQVYGNIKLSDINRQNYDKKGADRINELEEYLQNEDTRHYVNIVKYRKYLWV